MRGINLDDPFNLLCEASMRTTSIIDAREKKWDLHFQFQETWQPECPLVLGKVDWKVKPQTIRNASITIWKGKRKKKVNRDTLHGTSLQVSSHLLRKHSQTGLQLSANQTSMKHDTSNEKYLWLSSTVLRISSEYYTYPEQYKYLSGTLPFITFGRYWCPKKNNLFYESLCKTIIFVRLSYWTTTRATTHKQKKEQVPSPDSAICCKHLNITRAPNENPIRVTGLENFITAKIYSVRPSG